jgi:hypothetical protein
LLWVLCAEESQCGQGPCSPETLSSITEHFLRKKTPTRVGPAISLFLTDSSFHLPVLCMHQIREVEKVLLIKKTFYVFKLLLPGFN